MTSFTNAMEKSATTENGAVSHTTTESGLLDFFFKVVRNTPELTLQQLATAAASENEVDLWVLAFHLRDCRGGKGEKKQFYEFMKWALATNRGETAKKLTALVPEYGSWKDLLSFLGSDLSDVVVGLFAAQLLDDQCLLKSSDDVFGKQSISLCAKWAPSEGGSFDKKHKVVQKLCTQLGVTPKEYRKKYLGPLREHIKVVERDMCGKTWDEIDYSHVPSVCMFKNRKTFQKHDENRFSKWIEDVKSGKEKINAKMVFPHQLVAHYLKGNDHDEVVEQQWKAIVNDVKNKGMLTKLIPVCDVSGSMSGTPMEVSIALGILLSEVVMEPFKGHVITFSSDPKFHKVTGKTLKEKVFNVSRMDWGMSTNFQKCIDMIINTCKRESVPASEMPNLVVFSDMQFDVASGMTTYGASAMTNHEAFMEKNRQAGYDMKIVYWNLRGDTVDFPASSEASGTALVSGFSPTLLQLFMDDGEMTPNKIMRKAIDNERYDKVRVEVLKTQGN